jgi:hypothetical protein
MSIADLLTQIATPTTELTERRTPRFDAYPTHCKEETAVRQLI